MIRFKQLMALSNVVLLDNPAAEGSRNFLEGMIHKRIDKEFEDPDEEEKEIIQEIKEKNLRFVERISKQHRNKDPYNQILANVREKDVHLFYKFADATVDRTLLEDLGDALKRAGVKSTTLYMPFIPCQRQDKKDDGRVPISAKNFFDVVNVSFGKTLKRFVTVDLHAPQAQAHFDGPVDELSAIPQFAAYYRELLKEDLAKDNVMVFACDAGGAKRARYLSKLMGGTGYFVLADKGRPSHGRVEKREFFIPYNVGGKKLIGIDDMVDTAGSLAGEYEQDIEGPIQFLQGLNAEVYFASTHHILSQKNGISAEERLRRCGAPALFTNSLPKKNANYYQDNADFMTVLGLEYDFAKAFYCNQAGESISAYLLKREKALEADKLNFVVKKSAEGLYVVEG